MRKQFFLHYFLHYSILVLLPVLTFGFFAIALMRTEIHEDISRKNHNLLTQACENIDQVLNDSSQLSMSIDNNPYVLFRLRSLLQAQKGTQQLLWDMRYLDSILSQPENGKAYIHSSYVYVPNENQNFLSSKEGLVSLNTSYDSSWYVSYKNQDSNISTWTELRTITPLDSDNTISLLTIYRRIWDSPGIVVVNVLPNYLEKYLNALRLENGQGIAILNESGEIILKRNVPDSFSQELPTLFQIKSSGDKHIVLNGKEYLINRIQSQNSKWQYFTLIEEKLLYHVPAFLTKILLCLMAVSLLIGLCLAWKSTRRLTRQIYGIIDLFQAAEKRLPLPSPNHDAKDAFSSIVENIIQVFLRENHLTLQLAEKNYQLTRAELLALQAQINPHFIFNTLEMTNLETMTLTGGNSTASQMIQNLASMLRYSLPHPNEMVDLKQEIQNTKHYLELQKFRLEELLDYDFEIDDLGLQIPSLKLIIQPLVENSIQHGLDKSAKKTLQIHIKVSIRKNLAIIHIEDNGKGISADKLNELSLQLATKHSEECSHIGLSSVHWRIRLHYGNPYGLSIISIPNTLTRIELAYPFRS